MKCNIDRFNLFFDNENYDIHTKKFVLKILKSVCDGEIDEFLMKTILIDLEFYEFEKNDEIEDDDAVIIDFYQLNEFNSIFRKMIVKLILSFLKGESEDDSTRQFLIEDLKVIIPYKDWKRNRRKNKLKELKKVK